MRYDDSTERQVMKKTGLLPDRRIVAGGLLATLIACLLVSAGLCWEKSHWTPFELDGITIVEDADTAHLSWELSQVPDRDGIRVEGYLFDQENPTWTSSKSVVVHPVGTQIYLKVPTMLVQRHDLTEWLEPSSKVMTAWKLRKWTEFREETGAWEVFSKADIDPKTQQIYDGAGFAAWLPLERLKGQGRIEIDLLDEDNGQHLLIHTHEEVGE